MAKLLIIEDDPYVLDVYKRVFAQQNYDIEVATDGLSGLEKARTLTPNLIILDLMIPKLNGLEVLKKLKSDPFTKAIHIVILTNLGDDKLLRECIALGAESFMVKAHFTLDQLSKEIDKEMHSSNG